jgi:hypothetical protein
VRSFELKNPGLSDKRCSRGKGPATLVGDAMPKKRTEAMLNVLVELGTIEKASRLAEVMSAIYGHRVTRPYAVDRAITEALDRATAKLARMEQREAGGVDDE